MIESASKMEEIIDETEYLIETLENLNTEIESYQVAKNNLIDVKEKLNKFIDQSSETLKLSKENFISINEILNSDLISKLNSIQSGIETIASDLNDKVNTLSAELSEKHEHYNKKMVFLTVLIIINIILTLSGVVLLFI